MYVCREAASRSVRGMWYCTHNMLSVSGSSVSSVSFFLSVAFFHKTYLSMREAWATACGQLNGSIVLGRELTWL